MGGSRKNWSPWPWQDDRCLFGNSLQSDTAIGKNLLPGLFYLFGEDAKEQSPSRRKEANYFFKFPGLVSSRPH
jgi:hypothetical protein